MPQEKFPVKPSRIYAGASLAGRNTQSTNLWFVLCVFRPCRGQIQGKRRKELQGQITDKEKKLADATERLGNIVREYGYSSVDNFMRVYHHAKADYADYSKQLKAWADKYGMKFVEQQFEQQQKSFETDIKIR